MKTQVLSLCVASVLTVGCGGSSTTPPSTGCSTTQLETTLNTDLARATSEVDFSFAVERQDGRRYSYQRGASTLQTSYESASTSKLVSAVIILRLVEQGYLSLSASMRDCQPSPVALKYAKTSGL